MISKKRYFALCIVIIFVILTGDEGLAFSHIANYNYDDYGSKYDIMFPPLIIGGSRPFLFPSDFLSPAIHDFLNRRAGRLIVTANEAVRFTRSGWPQFKPVFSVRMPGNMITASRSVHKRYVWQKFYEDLKNNPEKYNFTKKQIEAIEEAARTGKNPKGLGFVVHHSERPGVIQVVSESTHREVHHVGGFERTRNLSASNIMKATMNRWIKIALADFVFSVGYSFATNQANMTEFKKISGSVFSAWGAANVTEFLLDYLPTRVASTSLPILMFEPATTIATITYVITRTLVYKILDDYQKEQLLKVEAACMLAEDKARWSKLQQEVERNSQYLMELTVIN